MSDESQPSYTLAPSVRTPEISPGDDVEIAIYMTGYGDIEKTKINIVHSQPYVLSSENPGKLVVNVDIPNMVGWGPIPVVGDQFSRELTLQDEGTTSNAFPLFIYLEDLMEQYKIINRLGIADIRWNDPPRETASTQYQMVSGELIYSEGGSGGEPPLLLELNTAGPPRLRDYIIQTDRRIAQPGDYSVTLTLTYGDENRVFQDQNRVEFHVNSWVERNTQSLRIAGIIATSLAAIPVLPIILPPLSVTPIYTVLAQRQTLVIILLMTILAVIVLKSIDYLLSNE